MTDLSPLARLEQLRSLDLGYCQRVKNLAPLAGLRDLQHLDLQDTIVRDLSPLASLRDLQSLKAARLVCGSTNKAAQMSSRRARSLRARRDGVLQLATGCI